MICIDDKCIAENDMKEEWTVIIDIDGSDPNPVNLSDVRMEVIAVTNMDINDFNISIEYDNDGHVICVIVYVNDENIAKDVKVKVDNLDKSESCEGILCRSKDVRVREITHTLFISDAHNIRENHAIMALIFKIAVFLML